jgi:LPXTG-motif cell wall-anchored protein
MNKLIAALIAVFITLFGASLASAQYPPEITTTTVIEETTTTVEEIAPETTVFVNIAGETDIIPETTVPPTTVPAVLPATGSSGVSSLLQIGALFLSGGLIVAAVSRRRSTAPAA